MEEEDISDEQQDWRFVSASSSGTLPKRGEKDFEPDGTGMQQNALAESRNAMYTALDGERKHSAKNQIAATWYAEVGKARVQVARGAHFASIGKADSTGTIWLYPEEALYLVERGSMEMWYPQGLPMPLQAVYAACISSRGDVERYQVYSYLKKLGFIVQRHEDFSNEINESNNGEWNLPQRSWFSSLGLNLAIRFGRQDPLLKRFYRSFESAYKDLEIVPHHISPKTQKEADKRNQSNKPGSIMPVFSVWKPTVGFRKASPGPPDYHVAIVNARDQPMPGFNDVTALLDRMPVDEANATRTQTQRLKEGWRRAIVAVVDSGITTFYKVTDVDFGTEKVYVKPPPPKKKTTKKQPPKP